MLIRSLALTALIIADPCAAAASEFEDWWARYNEAGDIVENAQLVKQAVSFGFRAAKFQGYCEGGNFLDEKSILEDANKSSCCANVPSIVFAPAIVEAGTSIPWTPGLDLSSKQRLWSQMADEALKMPEDSLKEEVQNATRSDASQTLSSCLSMLDRKYPD